MRTVFRRCRGVPFKRRGSLGGCRLKNSFRNRGVQGGRGEGGKVNLPPYTCLIHAEGRRIHTFFDASFWTSFFDILARLDAKTADFGTPLAPSWAPNGAQNRPSGAKMLTFSQRRCALFPTYFHTYFLERSWAPFRSIWDGIWMNFDGFGYYFSMHFGFFCNKICRLPKKSLGEKSCIPGPFLGVYFQKTQTPFFM